MEGIIPRLTGMSSPLRPRRKAWLWLGRQALHLVSALFLVLTSLPLSIMLPPALPSAGPLAALAPQPAAAAGFIVNSTGDWPDLTKGNGACETIIAGECTLRAAIEEANALAGADTITFSVSGTIILSSNLPIVAAGGLTIDGSGQTVTISGNNQVRPFTVTIGASLTLVGLTVANGNPGVNGGGILNQGTLTVTNSTLSGNSAPYGGGINNSGTVTITNSTLSGNSGGGGGGGIHNQTSGTVTITNSTLSGNSAYAGSGADGGGGILNFGTATVTNSTLSGNYAHASTNGGGGIRNTGSLTVTNSTLNANTGIWGGGIYNSGGGIDNPNGSLTVTDSTLSGNFTTGSGGGIANDGTATVANSTLNGNTAQGVGGGIYGDSAGTLTVTNSTLSGNTGNYGGGIYTEGSATVTNGTIAGNTTYGAPGGGIYYDGSFGGSATLTNTIVSDSDRGGDCAQHDGAVTDGGNNLVRDGSCGFPARAYLGLGALADNGGPTLTHALLPGSPAIDAGNNAACAAAPVNGLDQRGVARPQGAACDIGAFEAPATALALPVVTIAASDAGAAEAGLDPGTFTVTRAGGETTAPLTVNYTVGGAATAGSDFQTLPGVVTVPPGTAIITVTPIDDTIPELAETVIVTLAAGSGYTVGSPGSATVNIADNDARAAFTVNSTGDSADALPGDGTCQTGTAGECTLRAAIGEANAAAGPDTVSFSVSGTITLGSSLPDVAAGGLTIDGSDQAVTISGNNLVRPLFVLSSASLTLARLTVAGGNSGNAGGSGGGDVGPNSGGGIYNDGGSVTVSNSTLSGNAGGYAGVAGGGSGGGIYNRGGSVTVSNSTLSGNAANYYGGGIYSFHGSVTVSNSTLSGNSTRSQYYGGGIYNDAGTLTVTSSTLSGNSTNVSAGAWAGGIYNSGTLAVSNSTLSGNSANRGGGIYNSGILTVTNTTVSGNSAGSTANTTRGGGIYHDGSSGGSAALKNTIVANSPLGGDCALGPVGTVTNGGNNLVENNSCGFTGGADPNLGPLANNGGPTQTHALLAGSPAIDAGNNAVCAAAPVNGADQRGTTRPQGSTCDIGAFELVQAALSNNADLSGLTLSAGTPTPTFAAGTLSYTASVPNATAGITVTPTAADSNATIQVQVNGGGFTTVASGSASGNLPLNVGSNTVDVKVTAQDTTTTKTYTVAVTRLSDTLYTVNDAADAVDATPGDGVCETAAGNGVCTLRAAIMEANVRTGAQTITFSPSLNGTPITLTIASDGTPDDAADGDLDINAGGATGGLTITGNGAANTVIQAGTEAHNGIDRVFEIFTDSATPASVAMSGLTIRNGYRPTSPGGAGILLNSYGNLTVTDSVVRDNAAYTGAGIYVTATGTALSLTRSRVENNRASNGSGGGIYSTGVLTVTDTTVSGNTATFSGSRGGGIYSERTVTIYSSTISGNTSHTSGGGVYYSYGGTSPQASLTQVTISNNTTLDAQGGGLYLFTSSTSPATLASVTITGNTAPHATNGKGGGIYKTGSGALTVRNTLVAGNTAGFSGPDCQAALVSGGYNLLGNNADCTGLTNGSNGDQVGASASPIDPRLEGLTDNGGPTMTHWLLPGSPTIDAGNPSGCLAADGTTALTTDQRGTGFDRSRDGNGDTTARCDVGAFELQQPPGTATRLAVTVISPSSPSRAPATFSVTVQSQDATGTPAPVTSDLPVTLFLKTGNGALGGTTQGTISANSGQVVISGVSYTQADSNVVLWADDDGDPNQTSGETGLPPGESTPFNVVVTQFTLSVATVGNGSVTSSPAGITCGATCSALFDSGAGVTLTATPDSGRVLSAWAGACTGTVGCTVLMDGAKSVSATFTPPTYMVNSAVDAVDANPGDAVCATAGGECTLRAAVQEANALAGAQTITFAPSLDGTPITLTIDGSDDLGAVGDLDLRVYTGGLTIAGNGAANTIIQAGTVAQNGIDRVFDIFTDSAAPATVSISGVTVQNGRRTGSPAGGGILVRSYGNLTLTDSVVKDNYAEQGGGIYVGSPGTVLSLIRSKVENNRASLGNGGGIYNGGALTLSESTISGNTATISSALGGGIYNAGTGAMTLSNSTISVNSADSSGGGVYHAGAASSLTNVTVSTNTATSNQGGGLYQGSANPLTLSSVTINGNTAPHATNGKGGGIYKSGSGAVTLRNTLLAGNTAGATGPDCQAALVSSGYNLLGKDSLCTGLTNGANGDQVGTAAAPIDPKVGSRTDNGGATATHGLLAASPAIDAGNPSGCTAADGTTPLATDQRGTGFPRARDGDGNGTAVCDIGAFELQQAPAAVSRLAITVISPSSPNPAPATFSVTVRSQDASGTALAVPSDLTVTLFVKTGSGILGGTTQGTIAANTSLLVISGVTYSQTDTNVVLRVDDDGDPNQVSGETGLAPGDSDPFNVVVPQFTLTVTKTGSGTVASSPPGISCGATCSAAFDSGATVTLTAAPDAGYVFSGWGGACTGTAGCTVVMDAAKSVSAAFAIPAIAVNSTADAIDAVPGDGICQTATAGQCTLRAAIMEANALAGAQTITLPAGTYTLTLAGANEDGSAAGDLDIAGDLTINGAGPSTTIVQASATSAATGIDRVFQVLGPGDAQLPRPQVTLSGLTVKYGNPGSGDAGGGISNQFGTLTLNNVVVSNNTALSGGGIDNAGAGVGSMPLGTVNLTNGTVVRDNLAQGGVSGLQDGGGIWSEGALNLTNATVSSNVAGDKGGGIASFGGTLTLTNSTVGPSNSAQNGGGIAGTGKLTATNATISGNSATVGGGGLDVTAGGAEDFVKLGNVTISGNRAPSGAGIAQVSGPVTLKNTIIANSFLSDGVTPAPDCSGALTSAGYNLIENATGCTISGDATGNLTGDPRLGALGNNGGPTATQALLSESPAIDTGNPAGCTDFTSPTPQTLATDQRGTGFPRAKDGNLDGTVRCDVGAYELQAPFSSLTIVLDMQPDDPRSVTFTTSGLPAASFELDDYASSGLPNTTVFTGLAVGSYAVTEAVPESWILSDISCSGAPAGAVTIGNSGGFDPGDTTVSVGLAGGEHVTCTFVNTPQAGGSGKITIVQQVIQQTGGSAPDPGVFSYSTARLSPSPFTLDLDSASPAPDRQVFSGLSTDLYQVVQVIPSGWKVVDIQCTGATSSVVTIGSMGAYNQGDTSVTVHLTGGEQITCTFVDQFGSSFPPTRLKITRVTPWVPTITPGTFSVTVEAQDEFGVPSPVPQNTNIRLSVKVGTGSLGETVASVPIPMGMTSVTFERTGYSKAQGAVRLRADDDDFPDEDPAAETGLRPGDSRDFTVVEPMPAGCTIAWADAVSGDWGDSLRWSPPRVPESTDRVCITGAGIYMVTLTGDHVIESLTQQAGILRVLGANGTFSAKLSATKGMYVGGSATLRLDSIDGAHDSRVSSGSGLLTNLGTIEVEAGSGGGRSVGGGLIYNEGVIDLFARLDSASLENHGAITVASGQTLSMSGFGAVFVQKAGSLTLGDTAVLHFRNSGILAFEGGTITGTPYLFSDTLHLATSNPASFTIGGPSDLEGDLAAGQSIWVQGGADGNAANLTSPTGFTNAGSITLESIGNTINPWKSDLTATAGTIINNGTINVNQGVGGSRRIDGTLMNTGTINVNADATIIKAQGVVTNKGTLTVAQGKSLTTGQTFAQEGGTLALNGIFTVKNGTFKYTGGVIAGSAAPGTGVLNVETSTLHLGAGSGPALFQVHGSSTLEGNVQAGQTVWVQGHTSGGDASLTGAQGFTNFGTIRLESITSHQSHLAVTSGTLTNDGFIEVNAGGGGTRQIAGSFNNTGTLDVNASLAFTTAGATIANSGAITVASGRALTLGGAGQVFQQNAGSLSLSGTGAFSADDDTFTYAGGSISGAPSLANSTLNLTSANVAGFVLSGPNARLSGKVAAGQTLWVRGGATNATLTSAGFVNSGTIKLESMTGASPSELSITSGTLTNNGTIEAGLGSGGSRQIAGNVTNTGSVAVPAGVTLGLAGGTFTNQPPGTVSGGGTLSVGAGATLAGMGAITADVAVAAGGQLSPGTSAGTLTITGNYTQDAAGTLALEVGGTAPGTGHDQLAVSGTATLAGTLNVTRINSFPPDPCDQLNVLTAGTRTGAFGTVNLPATGNAQTFRMVHHAGGVSLVAYNPASRVNVAPTSVNVTEGGATGSYRLCLASQPGADVTVTPSGTAGQVGLSPTSALFTNTDWELTKSVIIMAVDDATAEGSHSATVIHTSASTDPNFNNQTIGGVTVNITDNDVAGPPTVQLSAPAYSVNENVAGGFATVTVTRAGDASGTATVTFATGTGGTATAGADYTAVTGTTVTFNPTETSQQVFVFITNDHLYEGNETVNLVLSNPGGASLGTQDTAVLTILDDDPLAAITLSPSSGPPLKSVTVSGTGFAARETVMLHWDGTGHSTTPCDLAGTMLAQTNAGDDGAVIAVVTVPACAGQGNHTLLAIGGQMATAVFTVSGTAAGPVLMFVEPQTATVGVDATVDVAIRVQSGTQEVTGIETYLTFNPAVLEVLDANTAAEFPGVQVLPGDCPLPAESANTVNNVSGTIHFARGIPLPAQGQASQPVTVNCTLGTVRFKGKAAGSSPVHLALAPGEFPATKVVLNEALVPFSATDGSVQVAAKALVFISQPVKGAHSFSLGIQPRVEIREGTTKVTGDNTMVVTLRIKDNTGAPGAVLRCVDPDGNNRDQDLVTPGIQKRVVGGEAAFSDCKIDLKGQGYVLEAAAQGAGIGVAATQPFEVVWGGDANHDCLVDIVDFSVLVRSFGKQLGDAGYDARADLNGDNKVNILDFSVLVTMFGTRCSSLTATQAPVSGGALVTLTGTGYLAGRGVQVSQDGVPATTDPPSVTVRGDGTFTATLMVGSGTHVVKATQQGDKVAAAAVVTVP